MGEANYLCISERCERCEQCISEQSKERWMVRAVDQGAIERATDDDQRAIGGANDGVRSDGLCERWIRGLEKESKRRSDVWCERLIREK